MKSGQRIVVWFSCGSASACASKLAIERYGIERVKVVYCDTSKSEDEDNARFKGDVENWIGKKIEVLQSDQFSTVDEVIEARHYLAGISGAPCTVELKKIPRFNFQMADDIHFFGYTVDEGARIENFENNNPELLLEWILRDKGMTKADCHAMVVSAGIALPVRYSQGFKNNNCKCCVKATSIAYWVLSRRINPVEFERRTKQSREYGARLTRWQGKRIFIDEIPPDSEIPSKFLLQTESISCGPECVK